MNINNGDTAFMMLATSMVCLMTPGLALFYGGLARKRNVLFIMMQSIISMGIITLMWIFGGFSLAFGGDIGGVIGNIGDYFALNNINFLPDGTQVTTIPFALFFAYQMMFCVITVPLISGAFAERLNMKGYIGLLIFWTLLVYIPVAHWVWGLGFLSKLGFADFAGGAVIHTTAGFSALAAIYALGKRKIKNTSMAPNNLMIATVGTGLLWFGWFGFNSGGALKADNLAATAFLNTAIGLSAGMISWCVYALIVRKKVNFVDVLTGSVAGLATITPAAGYVNMVSAVIIGLIAGVICNISLGFQEKNGWDDALGVWGVHGMGGFTGTILIGVFADSNVNTVVPSIHQLLVQAGGAVLIAVYSMIVTFIILKVYGSITNIKPKDEDVVKGLDSTLLDEKAYDIM